MEFIKKFIELTRGYTLPATFASCFIIYAYAHSMQEFSLIKFCILIVAICALHLGVNLYDDYRDVKRQLAEGKSLQDVSFDAYIPKAVLIRNKTFSIKAVRYIIGGLFCFAAGIGVCFIKLAGWPVLLFMILGGLLCLFYPVSSRYNCAEIVVGLLFGPVMILGGYYALTVSFDNIFTIALFSIAMFFAVVTLLHTKNIMDWEFDIKDGKKTLAILSGSKQNAIKTLAIIVSISYIIVLLGVLFNSIFNPKMLLVFLTLPIATKLIASMKDYIMVKNVEFKPRWYWGFFENWKNIQDRGIAFFMFRFYLARNFSFFFALFAAIGAMN